MKIRISKINKLRHSKLPLLIWFVVLSAAISGSFGGLDFFGFYIKGYAWFVQIMVSAVFLLRFPKKVSFPWHIWFPWICLVMIYLAFSDYPNALQRSVMMLCPIVVGMAVSIYPIREEEISVFNMLCRYLAIALCIIVIFKTGIYLTGKLPEISGLAAEVMIGTLLAALFAVRHAYGNKDALPYWAAVLAIPVIAVTRTAIVATALTLPLTFAPMKFSKRLIIFAIVCALGIGVFYTERFQKKMFYSGQGAIKDLALNNPDFRTVGRAKLWEMMEEEIKTKPWLGHGANAQEEFIFCYAGFYGQPHNDWIRLLFDYGYLGTLIYAFCIILQSYHAWNKVRVTTGGTRMLFYAGASSFLPFVLFMFTDNIILYVSFFGNLHFTILGLAYASLKTSKKDTEWLRYQAYTYSIAKQQNLSSKK
jgi:O-antigen ligase